MSSKLRAIFFDAGNTLVYPRCEELAGDLAAHGFPATVEDFFAAERAGKSKLDEWLWPQIRKGEVPRTIDQYYWGEYLHALMDRIGAPEDARGALMLRVANGFRDIKLWSRVLPETPAYLENLRGRGYFLGVISNSIGTIEEQLGRVDLLRYFHTVLDSAIVGIEKPHPEIFRQANERAGAAPSETIFIGDTHSTDVGGAQLAGIHGVLIDRVGAYAKIQSQRITSLPELDKILEEFSNSAVR
ncbi:MAG TPA: HAD family hydrolase [Terriglobia bacterium]|nr:HAD family hydrolase [Terriglobia bacterium]